jgi:glycosyltransferase involved in cell wall biosynthesis
MRVWLITIGEPLPTDGKCTRLLRSGILASRLAQRGHDVLWWTSAFDHNRKAQRVGKDTTLELRPNLTVKLLRSPIGYRKNISVARIANHYHLAWKFRRFAEKEVPPDLIVSSLPTAELSLQAVRYARRRSIAVVLDARDMWPDLLIEAIPTALRWFAHPAIVHLRRVMAEACHHATSIIGITPAFVEWALGYAQRPRSVNDADFPLANDSPPSEQPLEAEAIQFWNERGIRYPPDRFIICFFGNIGTAEKYDWQYVLEAAGELQSRRLPISFVICGDGDGLARLKRNAASCSNIVFGGWVNAPQITALMRFSQLGLIPYRNRKDFQASYPNKAIEYLSAGLPMVSSLNGELGKLLMEERVGSIFHSGKELSRIIVELYEDRRALESLSENARALYARRFNPERVYGAFISHLEAISKRASSGPPRAVDFARTADNP